MSTQVSAQGEGSQQQYLLTSLVEIGSEYDCYFTIEEAWAGSEPQNRLESYMVHRAFKQEGLQEELRFLQQLVPNLAFQVNSKNPKIIHVIDTRLLSQREYGLEAIIKKLEFSGNINEFVTSLSRQGVAISKPKLIDLHEGRDLDLSTAIDAKAENLKVRDALSLFVPLKERGRILWIARTKLGQAETSYVLFRGPRKR